MRHDDFFSLIPIDEKFGDCAWFAGLDWSLTHWSKGTPGYTRNEFIACLPGGVEHIGRESCWQGYYNDEFGLDELFQIRNDNLYNIIKKYPPRHTYISQPYWYEKITDDELSVKCGLSISDNILDEHCAENIYPKLINIKTLAFNYIWPEYGLEFLEDSINSALKIADAYLLYINYESFICETCESSKYHNLIKNLLNNYKDKPVYFILNHLKINNIPDNNDVKLYFTELSKKCIDYNLNIQNLILVQSDEIYDTKNIEKFNDLLKLPNITAYVTNPICYMNTPNWQVSPIEECDRITLLSVPYFELINFDWAKIEKIKTDINFIHLSYVLPDSELRIKLQNWGHRKDVADLNMEDTFINKLDEVKTRKDIINLHPINATTYKHLEFNGSDFNNLLFMKYLAYLFNNTHINWNDKIIKSFELNDRLHVNYFPLNLFNQQLLATVLLHLIPKESKVFICSDNNGTISQFFKFISGSLNVYSLYSVDSQLLYRDLIHRSIRSKFAIFYGDYKTLSLFDNNYFDFVFFNFNQFFNTFKSHFIEFWPKLKKYGLFCGIYPNEDSQFIIHLSNLLNNHIESCPWGETQFNFYEKYVDLSLSINFFLKQDLNNLTHNLWLSRKG